MEHDASPMPEAAAQAVSPAADAAGSHAARLRALLQRLLSGTSVASGEHRDARAGLYLPLVHLDHHD